jgi:hypothetical protein
MNGIVANIRLWSLLENGLRKKKAEIILTESQDFGGVPVCFAEGNLGAM